MIANVKQEIEIMKNWKTTIGGLLSSTGKALTGGGVLVQLTQLFPASKVPPSILLACWWIALVGVIMGVLGTVLTAYFAADASTVNENVQQVAKIASAVDKINQQGPSSETQLVSKPTTNE